MNLLRIAPVVAALALHAGPAGAQLVYWTDTVYGSPTLNRAAPDGSGLVSVPLGAGALPEGLAVDRERASLYWVEARWSGASVRRASLPLSTSAAIVGGQSCGLAVHPATGQIYWTSSNLVAGGRIHRSNADGSGAQVIANLGPTANPRGIAVDAAGGSLFWADFDQGRIFRSNLAGGGVQTFLTLPPTSGPYGVCFDATLRYLIWTEYATGSVAYSPADIPSPNYLVTGYGNPTHVAFDPQQLVIYWSDAAVPGAALRRRSLFMGVVETLPLPVSAYGGLAIYTGGPAPVSPAQDLPAEFALGAVSPTPARGAVRVRFDLPRAADVRIGVLDVQGRDVATLVDGTLGAGRHETIWSDGVRAAAGVYFVRMESAGRSWTRRLILSR